MYIDEKNKSFFNDLIQQGLKPSEICECLDYDLKTFRQELLNNGIATCIKASSAYRNQLKLDYCKKIANKYLNSELQDKYVNGLINTKDLSKELILPKTYIIDMLKHVTDDVNLYMSISIDNQRINGVETQGFQFGSSNRQNFENAMLNTYGVTSTFSEGELRRNILLDRLERTGVALPAQKGYVDKILKNLKSNPKIAGYLGIVIGDDIVKNRRQVYDLMNVSDSKDANTKRFENMKNIFETFKNNAGYIDSYPDSELFDILLLNKKLTKNIAKQLSETGLINFNSKKSSLSKYEVKIAKILDDLNIKYIMNDRSTLRDDNNLANGLELDFLLTDYNVGIEINPSYSHNSNKYFVPKFRKDDRTFMSKPKNYHMNKFKLAKSKNVKLIQLYEWNLTAEFLNNHFKPHLQLLINDNVNIYYARNTIISHCKKDEDKKIAREFIQENHRSGNVPAKYYYLIKNKLTNEILAAASFVTVRNKSDQLELKRLAIKKQTRVIGLSGKICKFVLNELKDYNSILSYSDNNFGYGDSYEKSGFEFLGYTNPSEIFVSTTSGSDTYSWQINTSWGATKEGGVVYNDLKKKGLSIENYDSVQEYIERELSHKTGTSKGYNLVCDAGSSKWIFKKPL